MRKMFYKKRGKKKIIIWILMLIIIMLLSINKDDKGNKEEVEEELENIENNSEEKEIEVCFTPPSGCEEKIVERIKRAKRGIKIQAYAFTSEEIIEELIKARKREVEIKILLDKSNLSGKNRKLKKLEANKIKYKIDYVAGIAHNKIMIIDNEEVITGSFNFSKAADKKNAENVLFIRNKDIVNNYNNYWEERNNR